MPLVGGGKKPRAVCKGILQFVISLDNLHATEGRGGGEGGKWHALSKSATLCKRAVAHAQLLVHFFSSHKASHEL